MYRVKKGVRMVDCSAATRVGLMALLAAGSLTGCSEYLDRKETIAFSAGNAVQTNIITHVTDPWPVHARSKDIAFSGERMQRAVARYECGPAGIGAAPAAQNGQGSC
jgi:hypothetical protein